MLWNIADFLERKGYYLGIILVAMPIVYDIIGVMHQRDLHIKIETGGVILQIVGLVIIFLARIVRRWGKK